MTKNNMAQHKVPCVVAAKFLNNLYDVLLYNKPPTPDGFDTAFVELINADKSENTLSSSAFIQHNIENQPEYCTQINNTLNSFLPLLAELAKTPNYLTYLNSIDYKSVLPTADKKILVEQKFWQSVPYGPEMDAKLKLICENMDENNGQLNRTTLRSKAQHMVS